MAIRERSVPVAQDQTTADSIGHIVYDQWERAVEYITGLYRPDRHQYRMNLSRVRTDRANAWSPSG